MRLSRSNAGYTLIEMLTVIAILGLVLAFTLPRLSPSDSANAEMFATTLAAFINAAASDARTQETSSSVVFVGGQYQRSTPAGVQGNLPVPAGISVINSTGSVARFDPTGRNTATSSVLMATTGSCPNIRTCPQAKVTIGPFSAEAGSAP